MGEHTNGPWTYKNSPKMGAGDGCEVYTVDSYQAHVRASLMAHKATGEKEQAQG